jgi:hypothetical protein
VERVELDPVIELNICVMVGRRLEENGDREVEVVGEETTVKLVEETLVGSEEESLLNVCIDRERGVEEDLDVHCQGSRQTVLVCGSDYNRKQSLCVIGHPNYPCISWAKSKPRWNICWVKSILQVLWIEIKRFTKEI